MVQLSFARLSKQSPRAPLARGLIFTLAQVEARIAEVTRVEIELIWRLRIGIDPIRLLGRVVEIIFLTFTGIVACVRALRGFVEPIGRAALGRQWLGE